MTQVATLHAPLSLREHEAIGRNRLLAALPPGDFALLAPHLIETVLDKGTVLQEPGQTIRRVYFPHSGLASIMGVMPEGASIEAAAVGREGGIGLTTGLGSTLAVSRAVVQLQMRAAYLPTATFAEVTERSAAIRAMIVRHNDVLLAQIQQAVACNAVHHVQERLCRWLLQARDRTGSDMLPLTQEFLSGILGVQRTTVTIISRALQAQGVIQVRRGRIQINDARALEARACSCYEAVRGLADQIGGDCRPQRSA